jgi:hypothetical protein
MRPIKLGSPLAKVAIACSVLLTVGLLMVGCSSGGGTTTNTQHTTQPPVSTTTIGTMDFPSGKYTTSQIYSDQFRLAYTVNDDGTILVGIKAKTPGWVAVSIGSPHGKSDIWIGYVSGGQATLLDTHDATYSGSHPLDVSSGGTNDLTNITGSEANGVTTIEFKRKLDTGDKYDVPLVTGSNTIVWAIGATDDTNMEHSVVGLGTIEVRALPSH